MGELKMLKCLKFKYSKTKNLKYVNTFLNKECQMDHPVYI